MIENIKKIVPPRRFAVPLLGLVLTVGAISQRAQPVLSKQIAKLQATSPSKVLGENATRTWIEKNPTVDSSDSASISKAARLRRVLDSSSSESQSTAKSVSPGETYTWMQGNQNPSSQFDDENISQEISQESDSTSTIQARISQGKAFNKGKIPTTNFPNNNGVFLYGSSQRPGQLRKAYIVLEKQGGRVVGGMYMPSSEFNCFKGTLDRSGKIAMTVKGYAGDSNLTQVASRNGLSKTSDSEPSNYAHSVTLQDYYQLNAVGKNDRRILNTCKANFQ